MKYEYIIPEMKGLIKQVQSSLHPLPHTRLVNYNHDFGSLYSILHYFANGYSKHDCKRNVNQDRAKIHCLIHF